MKQSHWSVASEVLRHAFLSPDLVSAKAGFAYSDGQLRGLYKSLPDRSVLQKILLADCFLFPSPPHAMNLLKLREGKFLPCFYSSSIHPWYLEEREHFAWEEELPVATWMTLRLSKLLEAQKLSLSGQVKAAGDIGLVPHMAVGAAYGTMLYYLTRGTRLFREYEMRTSSIASTGELVTLGTHLDSGLPIKRAPASTRHKTINIALQYPL